MAFPSYGFLLSVAPEHTAAVTARFARRGLACAPIGRITPPPALTLVYESARLDFTPGAP